MAGKSKSDQVSQTDVAAAVTADIRKVRENIDGFELLSSEELRRLNPKYSLDPQAIEVAIAVAQLRPDLAKLAGFEPNTARDAIRREAAFDQAEAEAEALMDGIHGMRVVVYAAAADGAYRVLSAAKGALGAANYEGLSKAEKAALDELNQRVESLSVALQKKRTTSDNPRRKRAATKEDSAESATAGTDD